MSLTLLKAGAIAAAFAVAAMPLAAVAAPNLYGTISYDTKLKSAPSNGSSTIEWLSEDEDVLIVGASGSWFKVKVYQPGPDPVGWVKKSAVDVDWPGPGPGPGPGPKPKPGVQACFNGPFGYFCVSQ